MLTTERNNTWRAPLARRAARGRLPCLVRCHSRHGQSQLFFLRRCCPSDLAAVWALQEEVVASLPAKSEFFAVSEAYLRETLAQDFCVGAFRRGRLVLFSNMVVNRCTPMHLAVQLGYGEDAALDTVTYDNTFVSPAFRGYGLQRLAAWFKDHAARALGVRGAFATVAPTNRASCRNITAMGFSRIDRREMYGGLDRYIMWKEFRAG